MQVLVDGHCHNIVSYVMGILISNYPRFTAVAVPLGAYLELGLAGRRGGYVLGTQVHSTLNTTAKTSTKITEIKNRYNKRGVVIIATV